jgi:hypothetical protein
MRYSVIVYIVCIVGLTISERIYDHLSLLFTAYAFHIYFVHTAERRRLSMPDSSDQPQAHLSQSDPQANSNNSSMSTTKDIKQHRRYSRWCRGLLIAQVVLQIAYLVSNYWINGHLTILQMTTAGLYILGAALMEYDLRRKENEFWNMIENGGKKDVEKGSLAWEEKAVKGEKEEERADEKTGFLSEKAEEEEEKYKDRDVDKEKVGAKVEETSEKSEM